MAIATFKSLFWPQQRPLLLGFSTVDPWFKVALRRKGGLRNRGVGGSLADGVTWLMVGSQVHLCNRPICGGGRLMLLVALCFGFLNARIPCFFGLDFRGFPRPGISSLMLWSRYFTRVSAV
jgi:hypothetical protein